MLWAGVKRNKDKLAIYRKVHWQVATSNVELALSILLYKASKNWRVHFLSW
jgi:hypothetical protein